MSAYQHRLSCVVLAGALSLIAAAAALAQAPNEAADQKELYSYVLTTPKIDKLVAVMKDLDQFQKANPQLAKDSNESDGSIAGTQRSLEKFPQIVAILQKDGMTTREYVVGSMTLVQSAMAVGFKKSGTYQGMTEYSEDNTVVKNRSANALVQRVNPSWTSEHVLTSSPYELAAECGVRFGMTGDYLIEAMLLLQQNLEFAGIMGVIF